MCEKEDKGKRGHVGNKFHGVFELLSTDHLSYKGGFVIVPNFRDSNKCPLVEVPRIRFLT